MDDSTALTPEETQALARYETAIERGLATFIAVGNALLAIRDRRLYRDEYGTFEAYCRERWEMSKTNANRLIQSAQVAANLTPIGVIPNNECQVRPLASLSPDQQREAWTRAIETAPNGKVSGVHVQTIVAEMLNEAQVSRRQRSVLVSHRSLCKDILCR